MNLLLIKNQRIINVQMPMQNLSMNFDSSSHKLNFLIVSCFCTQSLLQLIPLTLLAPANYQTIKKITQIIWCFSLKIFYSLRMTMPDQIKTCWHLLNV